MNLIYRYITRLLVISVFAMIAVGQGNILRFTVLDENNKFYPGLKSSDVRVLHDNRPLQIASLVPIRERPLEILILIDASLSQERTLPDGKRAAEYFIDHVLKRGKDKVAIVSFTGVVSMRKDMTSDLEDAKKHLALIEFEPPAGYLGHGVVARPTPRKDVPSKDPLRWIGASSIWDSISKASDALANVKSDAGKAIIVITDGVNTLGETKKKECIARSVKNMIPVYSIGIGDDRYDGVHENTLRKVSMQTGGVSIAPARKLEDLSVLMGKFEQALRAGYEIVFAPGLPGKPGILTETTIEIVEPNLRKARLQIIQPKGIFSLQ